MGAVLNIIITHNGFPGVPIGFYRLTLMVWATPTDFQRVVATYDCGVVTKAGALYLKFTRVTHCVISEPCILQFFIVIHICDVHLIVALHLNASPSLILQVAHTSRG